MTLTLAAVLSTAGLMAQENPDNSKAEYHKAFVEDFDKTTSKYFMQRRDKRDEATDFRYFPGNVSLSEKGTDVLLYRIDPQDPAGAGRGPEIISRKYTSYGTYAARIRIPDVTKVQPNVGAVVGYFTYNMEPGKSLSEIDWEWLIADPEIVYIGTWTGPRGNLQRIGRTINLATGEILYTIYRSGKDGNINHPLTGLQNQPETIPAIEGFNAAKQFYTYGFDWYPDRLTWWILHPESGEKIVLWDYQGSTPDFTGIPYNHTYYRLNFWHTNNWPVETNPDSIEKPAYPYEVEVDWMSYTPFKEYAK
jgi:hypothetical protein